MKLQLIVIFLFLSTSAFSQQKSWQWGGRAGSSSTGSVGYTKEENVMDMATDNGGNLYISGIIYGEGSPTITGQANGVLSGNYYNRDILLAKYNCAGGLKWAKTFGGSASDLFVGMGVDTLGHVYVSGVARQPHSTPTPYPMYPFVKFGNDSVQHYTNQRSFFLAQYDTSGALNWIRWLDPDSVSYNNRSKYTGGAIHVSKNGRVELVCSFPKSLIGDSSHGGTAVADTPGVYIVSYNVNGDLINLKRPDFDLPYSNASNSGVINFFPQRLRIAETKSGKFIMSGYFVLGGYPDSMSFQGQKTGDEGFVACFNSNWQLLWKHTMKKGGFWYKPVLDNEGNIYLSGTAPSGQSFQSFTTYNSYPGAASFTTAPFVFKIDSSGNFLKGKVAGALHPVYASGVAVAGDRVYLASDYSRLKWDNGLEVYLQPNYMRNIQLTTLDKNTLEPLAIDSLNSSAGSHEYINTMEADKYGNIYIGGKMTGDFNIAGSVFYSAGGFSDMFWAKFGTANCNSSVVPLKLMTFVASWLNEKSSAARCRWQTAEEENTAYFIIQRSYDGKNFINVAQVGAKGTPSNDYTYTDEAAMSGAGNAKTVFYRLLMYDKDGRYDVSRTISLTRSVDEAVIHIAPNPAKDRVQLSLSGEGILAPVKLLFYDMYGRGVKTISLNGGSGLSIPISDLANGTYFIHLSQNGKTVAKEKLVVSR